jgi:integrase
MLEDGRQELWLATALAGFFGLRNGELALMTVEENGDVFIGGDLKRDIRQLQSGQQKEERLAQGLDLKGQPGEARRVAMLFRSGTIKLPKPIGVQIEKITEKGAYKEVGAAFAQLLQRYKPWQELVKQNPGLKPYSIRHGWAWRAHKYSNRPLHYSQAAAFMGHSVETHLKYYSSWVNRKELEEAGKKYNEALQSA